MGTDTFDLQAGWELVEVIEEQVHVGGVGLWRCGVAARCGALGVATGASANRGASARPERAYWELRERIAVLEAQRREHGFVVRDASGRRVGTRGIDRVFPKSGSDTWAYSRSNGIAVATTWAEACERSALELVERDRVLRSWFGFEGAPSMVELTTDLDSIAGYRWLARELVDPGSGVVVCAVFGVPCQPRLALVRGFGAGRDAAAALGRAESECLQSLAFLHDEAPPDAEPVVEPTPMFHLDWYLYRRSHRALENWLTNGHAPRLEVGRSRPKIGQMLFADLSGADPEKQGFVARALTDDAVPLTFGADHPDLRGRASPTPVHPVA